MMLVGYAESFKIINNKDKYLFFVDISYLWCICSTFCYCDKLKETFDAVDALICTIPLTSNKKFHGMLLSGQYTWICLHVVQFILLILIPIVKSWTCYLTILYRVYILSHGTAWSVAHVHVHEFIWWDWLKNAIKVLLFDLFDVHSVRFWIMRIILLPVLS